MNDVPCERREELPLLSFDCGDARGLSQLKIMADIMNLLDFDDTGAHKRPPYEVFDVIGGPGTGTGGLFTLLLVGLGLTVEQTVGVFSELVAKVYEKREEGKEAITTGLKVHLHGLLEKYHVDREGCLMDLNLHSKSCEPPIPVSYKQHVGDMCMLHNFDPCQEEATNLTFTDPKPATLGMPPLSAPTPVSKNTPSPKKERFIPSCFRHSIESNFHSSQEPINLFKPSTELTGSCDDSGAMAGTPGKTGHVPQIFKRFMHYKVFDRLGRAARFHHRHLEQKPYKCHGERCGVNVNFQPREHAPNGDPDPAKLSGHIVIPDYQLLKFGRASLVYPGVWRGRPVAVKVLKAQKSTTKATNWESGVRGEITSVTCAWTSLKHPNLLPFYGHSEDFGDFGAFISPWYERGSAQHYLATRNPARRERVQLTLDVCHGLRYLHEASIIHGDLKPMNVLIDDDGVGRVCDFGLSELVYYQELCDLTRTTVYDGPERYMAPELFASADHRPLKLTFQGDIYSLGCIALQFIEGLCPFQRASSDREVIEAILSGLPPALRSESSSGAMEDALWTLLAACWGEALSRPTITTIVEIVGSLGNAGCAEGL